MTIDDSSQDVGDIGKRIAVVELAGFDQGRGDGPVFGATVGSGKQRVLAIELDRTDRSFDCIVVKFDAAVIDEARESLLARDRVSDGFGELDLLADQTELGA